MEAIGTWGSPQTTIIQDHRANVLIITKPAHQLHLKVAISHRPAPVKHPGWRVQPGSRSLSPLKRSGRDPLEATKKLLNYILLVVSIEKYFVFKKLIKLMLKNNIYKQKHFHLLEICIKYFFYVKNKIKIIRCYPAIFKNYTALNCWKLLNYYKHLN